MQWASAISEHPRLEAAFEEAAAALLQQLGGAAPDLVLVFVSAQYRDGYPRVAALSEAHFGGALLLGCSAGGVIGQGREIEGRPALALTAARLPGVRLTPFHFGPDAEALPGDPAGWHAALGLAPSERPHFILLPEPFRCDLDVLVEGLDAAYPQARKIGGVASGGNSPGDSALWLGRDLYRFGAVGVALSGDITCDTLVAQGCRPIGNPLVITRCEYNLLYELGGKPAVAVLRSLYDSLPARDQQLFQRSLFLGIEMKGDQIEYAHGDFLIRNLVGVDRDGKSLVVGALLEPYQAVQFHLRDAAASSEDLRRHLEAYKQTGARPAGALLFSCLGRGEGLYGHPDHDSQLLRAYLGEVPIAGFFCNGEIGPVGGQTFIHGYTSSFGLFRANRSQAN